MGEVRQTGHRRRSRLRHRHATIALAEAGIDVYGIDLSTEMLAVAEAKAEQAKLKRTELGEIVFLQQDMRDWMLTKPVDAVYSFCDSLNYLPHLADLRAAFASVYRGLAPGGLFLFDMLSAHQFAFYDEEQPFVLDEEDIAYIWHCDFDPETSTIEHELTLFHSVDGGATFRRYFERHLQRAYAPDVVVSELERAGFREVALGGDFVWGKEEEDSERLFFAAVKR